VLHGERLMFPARCETGGKHDEPMDGRTDFGVGDLRHHFRAGLRAGRESMWVVFFWKWNLVAHPRNCKWFKIMIIDIITQVYIVYTINLMYLMYPDEFLMDALYPDPMNF